MTQAFPAETPCRLLPVLRVGFSQNPARLRLAALQHGA
jgi:hypothetical protein